MTVLAHIAGVPVEETAVQFVPLGVAIVAALHLTRDRTRRWLSRVRSRLRLRPSGRG